MIYDYNVYYRQNCIVPLIFSLFCAFCMAKTVRFMWKKFSTTPLRQCIKEIAISGIAIALLIFLTAVNLINLSRGGIYLLFEKETDIIEVSGVIEDTIEIDAWTGCKYGTENNHGRGEALIVNGKKYYLTTYGDLKVGDKVILKVLPRSKFVIEMQEDK